MKKIYCSLVSLLLIAAFILTMAACSGDNTQNQADTTTAVGDTPESETAAAETTVPDNLPDVDLNGFKFRILVFDNADGTQTSQVYVDEMTGSVVNDAVYNKIATVEERFNVDVVLAEGSSVGKSTGDEMGVVRNSILSGDDIFDIATAHDISMGNFSLEGYFINVYDIPHLDFDKPWWSEYTINSLSIGNQLYFMCNTISYHMMGATRVMYFNKNIFNDMNQQLPYGYVQDGSWTLEKMNSITKTAYQDLNGNNEIDDGDMFGFVNPKYYYCFLEPFNKEPYQKDASGNLYYDFDVGFYSTLTEKFYSLLFGEGGLQVPGGAEQEKIFTDGRAMFVYAGLGEAVNKYSHSDVVYGILPMPKLDETQSQYYSGCTDRPYSVPVTVNPDTLENIGIVIEALSAEGYRQVFPAYFELALKVRYADQTEDAEMIDIVQENVILSLNYLYGNFASPYLGLLENLFNAATPSTDVASYAAKNENAQIARCEKIMADFEKMMNP